MAGQIINSGCGYNNQSGRINTHYAGSCCEWCDDLTQGRAVGNIPPQGSLKGERCADWMCTNPNFCANRGLGQPSRPQVSTPQQVEEWSNVDGQQYLTTGLDCDDIMGGCPTNNPIGNMPGPKTDYEAGDVISKQFDTLCGPYADIDTSGACARVRTTFEGTITGEVQLGKLAPKQYEVEWNPIAGFPDGIKTYVLPHNIFPVSSVKDEEDEKITELEIAEEEAGVITAGLRDNKVILYALLGFGAYMLFSKKEK